MRSSPRRPVGNKVAKHIGNIAFEPIVVEVGAAMAKPFLDWINACLDGQADRRNGAIGFLDYRMEERSRLEWTSGLITKVAFPAADGSSREAVTMRVTIQPEQSRLVAGSGAAVNPPSGAHAQKATLASNFQFSLSGVAQGLNKVVKVAPVEVVRRTVRKTRSARRGITKRQRVIDVGNVAIWLPVTELTPLTSWFDDFVIAGRNEAAQERSGSLTFLDPSLHDELLSHRLRRARDLPHHPRATRVARRGDRPGQDRDVLRIRSPRHPGDTPGAAADDPA